MSSSTDIAIVVAGQAMQVPQGTNLAELVSQLGHEQAWVATAVNGQFVPREERAFRALQASDAVLFFKPIVGG